jgi:hypothetical protein
MNAFPFAAFFRSRFRLRPAPQPTPSSKSQSDWDAYLKTLDEMRRERVSGLLREAVGRRSGTYPDAKRDAQEVLELITERANAPAQGYQG